MYRIQLVKADIRWTLMESSSGSWREQSPGICLDITKYHVQAEITILTPSDNQP